VSPSRRPQVDEAYLLATRVFSVVILGFGAAILIITLARGGGPASFGFLIGLAFLGLGAARLYLALRGQR
jgi:hypothetical protein